jgi:hypothetical protein
MAGHFQSLATTGVRRVDGSWNNPPIRNGWALPAAGDNWSQAGLSFLLYFFFAISFGVGMFTIATSTIFVVLISTLVRIRRELYSLLFAFV